MQVKAVNDVVHRLSHILPFDPPLSPAEDVAVELGAGDIVARLMERLRELLNQVLLISIVRIMSHYHS